MLPVLLRYIYMDVLHMVAVEMTTSIQMHIGHTIVLLLSYVGPGGCHGGPWGRARGFRIIYFQPCPMILLMNFQPFLFLSITHLVGILLTLRQTSSGLWPLPSGGPQAGHRSQRGGGAAGLRPDQSS